MAGSKATDDKINDLKERIDRNDGTRIGANKQVHDTRSASNLIISVVIALAGVLTLLGGIVTFVFTRVGHP